MLRIECGIILAIGLAAPAHAQTNQASTALSLSGAIDEACTVDTDVSQANVSLIPGASQDVTGVTYTCNTIGGFTRAISSQNSGALVRGTRAIPYTISHSGASGLSFGSSTLSTALISIVPSSPGIFQGSSGVLSVSLATLPPNLVAGEYSDILTIGITSN